MSNGKVNKKYSTNTKYNRTKKTIDFFNWAQEYSKKIVSITFFIFVLSNIFFLGLITAEFLINSNLAFIDTYMQEVHVTFREVIGGYLIKAATENVIKIGGSFVESYMVTKADILRENMIKENGLDITENNIGDEQYEYEFTEDDYKNQ